MGYHRELEARDREHEGDAQARHPHPARRRLRLRLDAARHQREGPRVLRQARRHEHDGGAAVGHRVGRADDEAWARCSATSARAAWPTSCWSTATRWPTSRVLQDKSRILAVMKDGEFHRAPPVRAVARARTHPLGRLRSMRRWPTPSSPTSASSTAAAPTPYTGSVLVQGNRIRQVGRSTRADLDRRRDRDRRRRRDADARHVRGAHALLVERRRHAGRHPDDAARGARAVVRQGRQALPRGRLHLVRRRGLRQAAARRGDPQRDRRRPDSRAALPRRQPGDHRARRRSATRRCRTCRSPSSASASTSTAPTTCARRCACS